MKKLHRYNICLIILFCFFSHTNGQTKKNNSKRKVPVKQQTKQLIFKSEEDLKKWIYEDSLKRAVEDSINFIKDSINSEIEAKKYAADFSATYDESWYPRDSLSYVDDIVATLISANPNIEADSAASLIKKRFPSSLQKARAIFFWVAATIKYDFGAFSGNAVLPIFNNDDDAIRTFKYKSGVCQNYANLYQYMCKKAGIECKVIFGWGKNFPICVSPQEETNHAWNAVKTNKGWMLLDATWATRDSGLRANTYWFNTPPEQFVYSHFPEDSSFQFLKTKVTKKSFLEFPIVSPFLFISKLDFEIPDHGNFVMGNNRFTISIPQDEKNYTISYSIMPYQGDNWRPYISNRQEQQLETRVIPDKKNKMIDYEVEIPSKGTWWLSVSLNKKLKNKKLDEVSFPEVILLKITY